jgi:hypothetical protein
MAELGSLERVLSVLLHIIVVGNSLKVVIPETFVHHSTKNGSHPNGRQLSQPIL